MKATHTHTARFWRGIAAVLATILVIMPFHAFLSTWLGTAIGPLWLWKSWKEIVLVAAATTVLGWLLWRKQLKTALSDKLILILCTYAVIVLIVTALSPDSLSALAAGLAMDLRYLVIFGLALMVARYAPELRRRWLLRAPRLLIIAGAVLVTIGVLQVTVIPLNFLEVFGYNKETTIAPYVLIDDNPEAPRAFATLRGPNDYGAYLILPLVVVLLYLVRVRDKVLLSLMLFAGLVVSASRSALLGAGAAIMMAVLAAKQMAVKRLALLGSAAVAVGLIGLYAAITIPQVRLAIFHSSPGDSSLTEGSTDAHWSATMDGIDRVVDEPFGCGAGCAGPASYYGDEPKISENYYVQIAETYGIFGLIVWLAIFCIVMVRLWRHEERLSTALFASGVGLAVIGLWLHVWSDDPVALTWWCLAGIVLGSTSGKTSGKQVQ